MEFLLENWWIILIAIAALTAGVIAIIKFFHMPSEKQLKKVEEWLVFACAEAEKAYGSGMGQMKLRSVYDVFLTKFPFLVKYVTYEAFSALVTKSLEQFKRMLESNKNLKTYVEGGRTNGE